jgi:hypothetical protein
MGVGHTIGTGGFISWFYAVIYVNIRKACKNIIFRLFIHALGLIFMIIGLNYLVTTFPSAISAFSIFLIFIGFVIFMIPMGVE